jgi:hypothetical protein
MTPDSLGSRRPKLIGVVVLAATLVAGTLAGAAADRVLGRDHAAERDRPPCPGGPGSGKAMFDALDLSPDQKTRVDSILERRRSQMELVWQETRPRMRALVDSTEAEIRAVLRPDQRTEFDRLREEGRRLWLKRHGEGGRPGKGTAPPGGGEPR